MQKKLLALAIAGLAAAPVFAQSNVTIYGLVDVGYGWRGHSLYDGVGSQNAINSGQASGSRLGFKGTEDLGNGLKALFTLETGINVDTGSNAQGGLAWGRQTFAGLTGDSWGTVIAGRFNTPSYNLWLNTDPFALGTVGRADNITTITAYRANNALAYVSPSWGGFNITAAYATNALGAENLANQGDGQTWTISPVYNNGPLMVGLNYQHVKVKGADIRYKDWDLGATYDFKFMKLAAGYSDRKATASGATTGKFRHYMLGVTVPINNFSLMASYNYGDDRTSANADGRQWAIGAVYSLSKRTDIYTAYSDIKNKNDFSAYTIGDAGNPGQGYQRGFNLGIRHRF